ncbi:hypothetical protein M8C17_29920 [Micromonospora sp. RHAY321]|uniref:hypothetical protein n=1 Tax=Micromonospora sp. RHAY321 TaxID=2944807 RepID=UPI00207CACFE|nr:hypothetical protein [Micromonospora sp. RHAY321]MCO1599380.1 hypothetical protein [Micromonospora sp. RHAY321]
MLPVALTCPLWWVARWATRVLTSLAVVAALALGAGTAPATASGSMAPASGPTAFTPGLLAPTPRPAPAGGAAHTTPIGAEGAVEQAGPTWSTDGQATPLAEQAAAVDAAPVRAAGASRLPRSAGPASRAPRAPPAR